MAGGMKQCASGGPQQCPTGGPLQCVPCTVCPDGLPPILMVTISGVTTGACCPGVNSFIYDGNINGVYLLPFAREQGGACLYELSTGIFDRFRRWFGGSCAGGPSQDITEQRIIQVTRARSGANVITGVFVRLVPSEIGSFVNSAHVVAGECFTTVVASNAITCHGGNATVEAA